MQHELPTLPESAETATRGHHTPVLEAARRIVAR